MPTIGGGLSPEGSGSKSFPVPGEQGMYGVPGISPDTFPSRTSSSTFDKSPVNQSNNQRRKVSATNSTPFNSHQEPGGNKTSGMATQEQSNNSQSTNLGGDDQTKNITGTNELIASGGGKDGNINTVRPVASGDDNNYEESLSAQDWQTYTSRWSKQTKEFAKWQSEETPQARRKKIEELQHAIDNELHDEAIKDKFRLLINITALSDSSFRNLIQSFSLEGTKTPSPYSLQENEQSSECLAMGRKFFDNKFSHTEQLLVANPDIAVLQSEFFGGMVEIFQSVNNRWRNIRIDTEREEDSQGNYPTIILSAYEEPRGGYASTYELSPYLGSYDKYGLTTVVKLHVDDDEQVTAEAGYKQPLPYPHQFTNTHIRYVERHANPIPPQEIVATARTGLEMLKTYKQESFQTKMDIFNDYGTWDNSSLQQIYAGEPGREDFDSYIAEALPGLSDALKRKGITYNYGATKAIYALNALSKVTDGMLPSEMPPSPQNRREPPPARKRTRPPGR